MALEKIELGSKTVFLIGTAHISHASVELVQQTIEEQKPQAVGIELDAVRLEQIQNQQKWKQTNIADVIKTGRMPLLLLNIFLSNVQRRLGETVQVKPGQEMMQAIQSAQNANAQIFLLDRPLDITMKRANALIPLVEKLKIVWYLFSGFFAETETLTPQKIEELKQDDMVSKLINELAQKAPTLKKVLVDERDSFIAHQIRMAPVQSMVAVVGAGHLQGIKKLLTNPVQTDSIELQRIPKPKPWNQLWKWIIPLVFLALLVIVVSSKGLEATIPFLGYWILITGGLSAIGALFAKSHPYSIAAAFVVAPLTTIHPFLASGWFAAGVEAKYNKPKVQDFEELNNLNSYRDFEKNKVTHLLLVAAYTNIGSTIGVLIALPALLSLIG